MKILLNVPSAGLFLAWFLNIDSSRFVQHCFIQNFSTQVKNTFGKTILAQSDSTMPPRAVGGMTVRKACATLGFPNPPTASKDLKKRFITLAKTHHPDLQETEESKNQATEKMASITEAYKLLKNLIENKTAGGRLGGSGSRAAAGGAAWETDTAGLNFVAPSIAKSSGDMWLPWQKAAPSRIVDTEKVLEDATDFWSFKASVRKKEERAAAMEAKADQAEFDAKPKQNDSESGGDGKSTDGKANDGTAAGSSQNQRDFSGSQYTSEHFKQQRKMSQAIKGTTPNTKKTSTFDLIASYWSAKGPTRILRSIRYIITGK